MKLNLLSIIAAITLLYGCKSKDTLQPNRPPNAFVVTPTLKSDGKTIVLNWTKAKDPDGDAVTYAVVLKDTLVKNISDTTFMISTLDFNDSQAGKVIAKDPQGLTTEASFTATTKVQDTNQTIYVIGDFFVDLITTSFIKALDANTGVEKWVIKTANVSNSPIVANGFIYEGNYSYSSGLTAYDAATGAFRWNFSTNDGYSNSSPVVANGTVYVGGKSLYALDATTGNQKWSFMTGGIPASSPVVANGVVYVGSIDGNLYAVDATTGTQRWSFATGANVYATPTVANGAVYIVNYDGKLYAIDESSGKLKWSFNSHYMISNPSVENGVVYVEGIVLQGNTTSGDKKLYAINATTGAEKWSFALGNNFNVNDVTIHKNASPVIADGVVYAASGVPESSGNLYAIDANTGTKKWQFTPTAAFYTPTVANGIVYVETTNGYLYAIDASTGTQKWQSALANNTFNFSPCVVTNFGKVYRGLGNIHL